MTNLKLERRKSKPPLNIIVMPQNSIFQFLKFQKDLNKNVNFVEYFIIINNILLTMIYSFGLIIHHSFEIFQSEILISAIMLSNVYFLRIQIAVYKRKCAESKSVENLHKWQMYGNDENILIELKVLRRSVRVFHDNNNSIDETSV
jgi:hypothetical protein